MEKHRQANEDLKKVDTLYFVTIPRSAYHLLAKRIDFYFDDQLGHYEATRYKAKEVRAANEEGRKLIGTHDGGLLRPWPLWKFLERPRVDGEKYVIQFRNPLMGLISHFRVQEKKVFQRKGTRSEWIEHSVKSTVYINRFVKKWLIEEGRGQRLEMSYERVRSSAAATLVEALDFMGRDGFEIDRSKVSACVERYPFFEAPGLEDFEYYERSHFLKLRELMSETVSFLEGRPEFEIEVTVP